MSRWLKMGKISVHAYGAYDPLVYDSDTDYDLYCLLNIVTVTLCPSVTGPAYAV